MCMSRDFPPSDWAPTFSPEAICFSPSSMRRCWLPISLRSQNSGYTNNSAVLFSIDRDGWRASSAWLSMAHQRRADLVSHQRHIGFYVAVAHGWRNGSYDCVISNAYGHDRNGGLANNFHPAFHRVSTAPFNRPGLRHQRRGRLRHRCRIFRSQCHDWAHLQLLHHQWQRLVAGDRKFLLQTDVFKRLQYSLLQARSEFTLEVRRCKVYFSPRKPSSACITGQRRRVIFPVLYRLSTPVAHSSIHHDITDPAGCLRQRLFQHRCKSVNSNALFSVVASGSGPFAQCAMVSSTASCWSARQIII